MIKLVNCSIKYEKHPIFSGLTLAINPGEKYLIDGPSGTGKSSLLKALLGFVPFHTGEAAIAKLPINAHNIKKIRQQTAYLPQEINQPFDRISDLFYAPHHWKNNHKKSSTQEVKNQLARFNLDEGILSKTYSTASGGQKQRLLLASILLLNKPVLLLDEAFSALDTQNVDRVMKFLVAQKEITMLIVAHNVHYEQYNLKKLYLPDFNQSS